MTFIINGWIAGLLLIASMLIGRRLARGAPPRAIQAVAVLLMIATVVIAVAPDRSAGNTIAIPESRVTQHDHIFTVWISIAVVLMLREVLGAFQILRMRRRWTTTSFEASEIHTGVDGSPMTVGLLRPVIYVPQRVLEMAPSRIRAIVFHEREHARFRDPLLNFAIRMLRIVFWPILPLLVFERLVRDLAEEAADRAALHTAPAVEYAESLAAIAGWSAASPTAGMALTSGSLEARITRILRPANLSIPSAIAATLVLLASLLISFHAPAAVIDPSHATVIRARIVVSPPTLPATKESPPAARRQRAKPAPQVSLPIALRPMSATESFQPSIPIMRTTSPPHREQHVDRDVHRTDRDQVVIRNVIRIVR